MLLVVMVINPHKRRVFQMVVRGVRGIANFAGASGDFLPGGENLRRSDFGHSNLFQCN